MHCVPPEATSISLIVDMSGEQEPKIPIHWKRNAPDEVGGIVLASKVSTENTTLRDLPIDIAHVTGRKCKNLPCTISGPMLCHKNFDMSETQKQMLELVSIVHVEEYSLACSSINKGNLPLIIMSRSPFIGD